MACALRTKYDTTIYSMLWMTELHRLLYLQPKKMKLGRIWKEITSAGSIRFLRELSDGTLSILQKKIPRHLDLCFACLSRVAIIWAYIALRAPAWFRFQGVGVLLRCCHVRGAYCTYRSVKTCFLCGSTCARCCSALQRPSSWGCHGELPSYCEIYSLG